MKLLIAEDEPLCLDNLKELDWAALGITEVLTAENGEQAYNTALSEKPDIILSDIQMPKMNGLELAEKLSVNLPESRFIILTAYNNFAYAQTAISNGVCSYILKPFLDDDVINAVAKAIANVQEQKLKNSYTTQIAEQLELSKHFLLGYFFNISTGEAVDTEALSDVFGITDCDLTCTAMVVSLEYSKEPDSFKQNYRIFNNLIKIFAGCNENPLSFFNTTQLIFFFMSDSSATLQKAQNSALSCADAAESYLNFNYADKYVIGLGNPIRGIKKCKISYNGALDAIKYSFYLGFNSVICISDLESSEAFGDYHSFPKEEFFGYVKAGDFENAKFTLNKLFDDFRRSQATIEAVQRICHEILVHLALCLMQCNQDPDLVFNKSNAWDILRQYKSLNDIEAFILDFVDVVISTITYRYNQKTLNLVNEVKDYIDTHLDTSLTEIADHFFHSPNYLSNIFSKEAGITIKNYMISERIERAKDLLANTDKSVGSIAAEVGYKNTQHFSTVFNKHVGVTPTVFRSGTDNR